MPPSIQPGESREQATIRWLTGLLAALVQQSEIGILVISRTALAADHDGQDLLESRDKNGDILLRFESVKHVAIYPLAGGAQWADQKEAKTDAPSPAVSTGPLAQASLFETGQPGPTQVSPPKNQEAVRKLEETLKKQKLVSSILAGKLRQTQARQASLEGLLESVGALTPQ